MGKHKEEATDLQKSIDEGFETEVKRYKEYSAQKVQYFQSQGIEIDVAAHEAQNHKAYLLGAIAELREEIKQLKGETNVTKETKPEPTKTRKTSTRKKSGKKRGSKKSRRKGPRQLTDSDRQLELGV